MIIVSAIFSNFVSGSLIRRIASANVFVFMMIVYYESIKRELNKRLVFVVYYEPLKRALKTKSIVVYYESLKREL